jgi:isopentenyldiphosphate isomerase
MRSDNNSEMLPLVDADGNVTGCATRGECHNGSKLLHPVVHLHLHDSKGRIYLQQRPLWKKIQPGKWDTAVGGHVDCGESITDALRREIFEEIGIEVHAPKFLMKYLFESEIERELIYVYSACHDGEVRPSEELDGGKFWEMEEIESCIGKGILTPNFEQEFMKIRELL